MERVTGIGAIFIRAANPSSLMHWYAEHLGITDDGPELPLRQGNLGSTFQAFPADTDYFGSPQGWMLNFRVRDLDAMLEQLRAAGAVVDEHVEDYDYGRFGWAHDPEGNRFELWQPADSAT